VLMMTTMTAALMSMTITAFLFVAFGQVYDNGGDRLLSESLLHLGRGEPTLHFHNCAGVIAVLLA
jgi:hypothetical protein